MTGCIQTPFKSRGTTRRDLLTAVPVAAVLGGLPSVSKAQAVVPAEVREGLASARLLGQGRLRFLGLLVYEARLWVADGFDAARFADHAFALELIYARRLVGKQIAERSLQEMQRVPGIPSALGEQWLADMIETFPDVEANDRITGWNQPRTGVRFQFNGRLRRDLADVEFARRFFGIWLADSTSQPALRLALLGRAG
jgi:hypothetical protein